MTKSAITKSAMTKSASSPKAVLERQPHGAEGQPRFKPVAIRAVSAACAVRGATATRKIAMSDLPAILRDEPRD